MTNKNPYFSSRYLLAALLLPAVILCYEPARLLAQQWGNGGAWRLIIVPVALLMWIDSLSRSTTFSYKVSIIPFILQVSIAAILLLVSYLSCSSIAAELAITAIVISVIWVTFGNSILVRSLWPIGYFIGMVTISARVVPVCAPFFQHISAIGTEHFLNLIGFITIRDGLSLRLPATTLRVGYWCSGANQLVSLLALAIPLAFFRHRNPWKQALLIGSALPIALFFNVLRIVLIAFWNYSVKRDAIHGPGEILLIPIIHPFAIVGLVGLSLLLDRNTTIPFLPKGLVKKTGTIFKTILNGEKTGKQWYFFIIIYSVLLISVLFIWLNPGTEMTLPKLPEQMNNFTKTTNSILPVVLDKKMYDTLVTTSYFKGDDTASVMIFALQKQRPARSLLLNVFENEEDWENKSTVKINGTSPFSAVKIQLKDHNEVSRYSALYWYCIGGNAVIHPFTVFSANLKWWFGKSRAPSLLIAIVTSNKNKNEASFLDLTREINSSVLLSIKQ